MSEHKWVKVYGSSNEVIEGDGFFLSYNPNPDGSGIPMFKSDGGSDETALVLKDARDGGGDVFLILNGDWREQYLKLFPDLDACKALYEENKEEHASSWSTDVFMEGSWHE